MMLKFQNGLITKIRKLEKKNPNDIERYYWEKLFDEYYSNEINSWAYAWLFSAFYNDSLTVTPNVNLVKNVGLWRWDTRI